MTIFLLLILGAIAGLFAKRLFPKIQAGSTTLCLMGMAGGFIGGWLASLLGFGVHFGLIGSLITALLGATSLIGSYSYVAYLYKHKNPTPKRQPKDTPQPKPAPTPGPAQRLKIVFLSYRRTDSSDITGRMYDRLEAHFGRDSIFKDVDSVPLGINFQKHIEGTVAICSAMVVVIGRQWLGQEGGTNPRNRLQDSRDFVRIEIEAALKRGIPIIPTFVQGATIPPEDDLPESLRELRFRNGIPLRSDPDFNRDMQRLIAALEAYLQ